MTMDPLRLVPGLGIGDTLSREPRLLPGLSSTESRLCGSGVGSLVMVGNSGTQTSGSGDGSFFLMLPLLTFGAASTVISGGGVGSFGFGLVDVRLLFLLASSCSLMSFNDTG